MPPVCSSLSISRAKVLSELFLAACKVTIESNKKEANTHL